MTIILNNKIHFSTKLWSSYAVELVGCPYVLPQCSCLNAPEVMRHC